MKADEKGHPTYRCARCFCISFSVAETTVSTLETFAANPPAVIQVGDVQRQIVHNCEDGGAGIATIIGLTTEAIYKESTSPPAVAPDGTLAN